MLTGLSQALCKTLTTSLCSTVYSRTRQADRHETFLVKLKQMKHLLGIGAEPA